MPSWKKILVDNISSSVNGGVTTYANDGNFTANNIALKTDNTLVSNDTSGLMALHAVASSDTLVWKQTATTLGLTTDNNHGTASNNAVDLIDESLSVLGGEGINTSVTADNTITIAGEDATASNKGIASFADADFSVGSGAVSIKTGGVSNDQLAGSIVNAKLANSTVSYGGVELALGESDPDPAFNLAHATGYAGDSNLVTVGTITSGQFGTDSAPLTAYIGDGEIDNTVIGSTTPAAGTFSALTTATGSNVYLNHQSGTGGGGGSVVIGSDSSGSTTTNVQILNGNLSVSGDISNSGTASFANGGMTIENATSNFVGPTCIEAHTWSGTGTVTLTLYSSTTTTLAAGDYWLESSQEDKFIKLSLAAESGNITSSATDEVTFTVEEWPQYDSDNNGSEDTYVATLANMGKIYTQDPSGDIHISFSDNVIFYGGGVMTSTSNFASEDNFIHLNTEDTNSDGTQDSYSSTTESGLVFGTSAANDADSSTDNWRKGGKIVNSGNYIIFGGLAENSGVTPVNQDTSSMSGYKDIKARGICFDAATDKQYTSVNDTPSGADAAIGLVGGVLMAYV